MPKPDKMKVIRYMLAPARGQTSRVGRGRIWTGEPTFGLRLASAAVSKSFRFKISLRGVDGTATAEEPAICKVWSLDIGVAMTASSTVAGQQAPSTLSPTGSPCRSSAASAEKSGTPPAAGTSPAVDRRSPHTTRLSGNLTAPNRSASTRLDTISQLCLPTCSSINGDAALEDPRVARLQVGKRGMQRTSVRLLHQHSGQKNGESNLP